ncbi:hypothetical protein K2173_019481 [Erythroxylum novogranatense]|uniref:Uncharacterized protein n=1 Tax=Erythroxylum novogranatense TaxID=1862640 RepID=A0AAV8UBL0_9ROSI|nr:hypothetical protein K2173_019481 [Erythroxylum novogranatense]
MNPYDVDKVKADNSQPKIPLTLSSCSKPAAADVKRSLQYKTRFDSVAKHKGGTHCLSLHSLSCISHYSLNSTAINFLLSLLYFGGSDVRSILRLHAPLSALDCSLFLLEIL